MKNDVDNLDWDGNAVHCAGRAAGEELAKLIAPSEMPDELAEAVMRSIPMRSRRGIVEGTKDAWRPLMERDEQ